MLEDYLKEQYFGPRIKGVLKFQDVYKVFIESAKGSQNNHQAWEGGYVDHLHQCFQLCEFFYRLKYEFGGIEFSRESAFLVLYFHDIEKIFKYNNPPVLIEKKVWLEKMLPEGYGIVFTPEEHNALKHIHGGDHYYSSTERGMNPLAAFCHIVDTASARIYFNQKFLGEPFQTAES